MVEQAFNAPQAERLIHSIAAHARKYLGREIEGVRADSLNHATGHAFGAVINLDTTASNDLHINTANEIDEMLSANDFSRRVTHVIYDAKDPNQQMIAFNYITQFEGDVPARIEERVMPLAMKAGIPIPAPETVFEMNFDAPWHHKEERYMAILRDGVSEALTDFFEHNPEATVYMYVNTEDDLTDGKILKSFKAFKVGMDVYLNHPDPTKPDQNIKDFVYVLNKSLFVRSLYGVGNT